MDHFALSVTDLDACVAQLGSEGVRFVGHQTELSDGPSANRWPRPPYKLGYTRAVVIEGPNREAIELVKVK